MAKEKNEKAAEETKRTSFILKSEVSRKLNIISAIEGVSITDLVNDALSELIAKYEKKNGEIPVK